MLGPFRVVSGDFWRFRGVWGKFSVLTSPSSTPYSSSSFFVLLFLSTLFIHQARILGLKNNRVSKKQSAPKPASQSARKADKQKSAAKESPVVVPEVAKETATPRVVEKESNDLDTLQFNNLLDTQKKGVGKGSAKLQSGNKVQRLKR